MIRRPHPLIRKHITPHTPAHVVQEFVRHVARNPNAGIPELLRNAK